MLDEVLVNTDKQAQSWSGFQTYSWHPVLNKLMSLLDINLENWVLQVVIRIPFSHGQSFKRLKTQKDVLLQ